jgi:UDP-glucose 4-epimerase
MRVLVTGGSGFLGTAVTRRLALAGHDVVILRRSSSPMPQEDAGSTVVGDLREPATLRAAMAGVQGVCHLAGLTHTRGGADLSREYDLVNRQGTAAVLTALTQEARSTGSAVSLVFASTAQVYGWPTQVPMAEEHPAKPTSPYGMSKLAAERLITSYVAARMIGAVTLRAGNVAGAVSGRGDHDLTRIIPRVISVAAGYAPFVAINGDGTALRDYLHVDDFATACVLALLSCRPGEHRIYNVGSGIGTSVLEIINLAEQITGKSIPVVFRPAPAEPRSLVGNIQRIRAELCWEPESTTPARIIADAWSAASNPSS